MIALSGFNKKWSASFYEFKTELLTHTDDLIVDIEHIGSTAIKDAVAKDIVDIQIAIN